MKDRIREKSKDFVQSLDRGLSIMKVFSKENSKLTLSEVSEITGFTRATARRFLLTLESLNYVGSSGRYFFLKPRVLELGYAYLSSFDLVSIAQNHLEELAIELRESCSASVLEGENVIYVCRAASNRIMTINLAVGTQLPAYATSMGRVLLSSLEDDALKEYLSKVNLKKLTNKTVTNKDNLLKLIHDISEAGWGMILEELEEGVQSVSVPIHSKEGKIIAAANVSTHAARVSVNKLRNEFLPKLQKCVKEIEKDLSLQ